MSTFYLDYEGGNDANDGLSYANRVQTFAGGITAARTAPGDTVRIMASPDPTSLGINATWTDNSDTVTLASALNVLIDNCDTAWTASPNVTSTADAAQYRTSTKSAQHVIAAGFTTGLASYNAVGGTRDYSAYQGITFWIYVTATVAASTLSIRLCSDAVGAVSVDTLAIPALPVANVWVPIYIDKGSALGNSIQSIALYCDADPGSITVRLDNISTVKAAGNDNLNLTTLIGKNTAGEYWWALRSINGTTVTLDISNAASSATAAQGYVGTTESVTTYKRNTIKTTMGTGNIHQVQESGSAGSLITYSGGWNRTDMSTQTGQTFFDGQCGSGTCFDFNAKTYISMDKVYAIRYATGFDIDGADCSLGTVGTVAHATAGFSIATGAARLSATELSVIQGMTNGISANCTGVTIGTLNIYGHGASTDHCAQIYGTGVKITTLNCKNFVGTGWRITATSRNIEVGTATISDGTNGFFQDVAMNDLYVGTLTVSTMTATGIQVLGGANVRLGLVTVSGCVTGFTTPSGFSAASLIVDSLTTSGNTTAVSLNLLLGDIRINRSSFAEASPISFTGAAGYYGGRLHLQNYDGTAGDHRIYLTHGSSGATIVSDTGTRHTASGRSWKYTIQDATYITQSFPARMNVARIALQSGTTTGVSIWTRRTSTSVTGTFRCRGGQVAGIASDLTASSSAAINTWEQLTLTLTPSADGVVDLDFSVYGVASQDVFIHDFAVL